jgi:23S rRNA (cytosine1962-C5)-methyltransferase
MTTVRVSRKGALRFDSGHPWIFLSDVVDSGGASPGDAVRVVDPSGRPVGTAHWSSTSQISLRRLDPGTVTVDREFFRNRIGAAQAHRERVVQASDAYRAVYSEGDLLPGLIVDRYGDCLAAQFLSQGMDRAAPLIVDVLRELFFSPRAIVARNDAAVRRHESLPLEVTALEGELPPSVEIHMNGLALEADVAGGQKTGIYLDQRENYAAAVRYAFGNALDCFTSTGGFALHLAARCASVEGVDSSASALATAARNRDANSLDNVTFREADVFDLLAGYDASGRRFETIVLDPPAFAKSRSAVEGALRGYYQINQRALRLLAPGGVLVTCSCSHHVSEAALLETVARAALDTERTLRVLERRTQSADHPILLTVPETHYLKCLILQVL